MANAKGTKGGSGGGSAGGSKRAPRPAPVDTRPARERYADRAEAIDVADRKAAAKRAAGK